MFEEEFGNACLPFDKAATLAYAEIVVARLRGGRPISVEDAQIAAIARSRHLSLATRHIKDFADIGGLTLLNPWDH